MRVWFVATAAVALIAAGCGGGGGGGGGSSDAASLVPADTLAYVTVDTDLSSSQLASANGILEKFPIRAKLLKQIRSSLAQSGTNVKALESSVGPEVDIAALTLNGETNAVGFTQPKDEKAFDAQLDKDSTIHTKIDGWTVFSDKQAGIDAVKSRKANLGDDATFQSAMKTVPGAGDAIVTAYASAAGVRTAVGRAGANLGQARSTLGSLTPSKWVAAAVTSQDGAFKLEVHTKGGATSKVRSAAGLADEIPSGSIVALATAGGGGAIPASVRQQLTALSQQLKVDLPSLIGALNGPLIAYVRPGLPLPEVTIASKPAQPQQAAKAIGQLLARFAPGKTVPTKVDGGTLGKVDLGSVALYYGANGGQLVLTDSANALAELKGSAGRLSGDSVFKEAKDGAGMPDDSQGFLFLDVKDAVPAITGFAQLANQNVPPAVEANLKPLRSLLLFGSRSGGLESFVAYLKSS